MFLRKLSKHELSQLAWHTIHFSINISGDFNLEVFRKAAIYTIGLVPLAHSKVVKLNDDFYFKSIDKNKVPFKTINLETDSDYPNIYKELINTAVDSTQSQLEITTIKYNNQSKHTIIFSIAHSVVSGRTGVEFIDLVLNAYQSALNEGELQGICFPLDSSMASLSSKQEDQIEAGIYADPIKLGQTFSPIPLSSEEANPNNLVTDFIDIPLQKNDFIKLKTACREHGVSVNSYLSACQIMASLETYPEAHKAKFVSHNLAVDPRKYIQNTVQKGNLMQFSYSGIFFFEVIHLSDVWSLAKDIGKRVEEYLTSDQMHATLRSIETSDYSVDNPNEAVLDENFHWTTCNSNLGLVQLGENLSSINVTDFKFIVNRINGSHLLFISSFDNTLSLRYAFSSPRYSKKTIQSIADKILEVIHSSLCLS
ncbi:phthiocerol/phthiodiolone dimycocerosyl transferase family protein [Vibrio sp. MEBiC08052]|uniref:phthiocerol/phthiodiolone dimycocerosyl transferase family protein n=1 Tax=Vibrio sp. MEBiC08052 TaxID=1761910 RepID=UPI0007406D67|nr:hypothetical protein [Vibrio sp. MEBiC08052]KUI97145.1 hypothetical protein VRK_37560 [Vibrio sp. MEBiC08052]